MELDDASMVNALDRFERLRRAKAAQAAYRAQMPRAIRRYAPPTPRARILAGPRFQRAYSSARGAGFFPRGMAKPEIKSFDLTPENSEIVRVASVAGTEPAAFATGMTEINDVQAGNAFYQRIGTKINVRSIMMRFRLTNSTETAGGAWSTQPAHIRYMMVYDRQPNGTFPAITDVLQNNDAGVVTHGSSVNIANRDRFAVLLDRNIELSEGESHARWVSEYISCPNLQTQFRSSAGTIGDITTGSLLFICFGIIQLGPAFDAGQIQNAQFRIRYADN